MSHRKITIVNVRLSENIDDIISSDLHTITEEQANKIAETAESKMPKAKATPQAEATQRAIDALIEATNKNESVPIEELFRIVTPDITNVTSMIMFIKNALKRQGNQYVLQRSVKNKRAVYHLLPFHVGSDTDD